MDEFLNNKYYKLKNPESFASPGKLYQLAKSYGVKDASLKKIREWLENQDIYT